MTITKDLTKLQKQMKALTEVKCPACKDCQDVVAELGLCSHCEGRFPGLDPKYDCLRLECPGYAVQLGEKTCPVCGERRWHALPADRAHEAVGRLMAAIENKDCFPSLAYDPEHKWGNWMATLSEDCIARGDTPEEALMAALRKAEGV